MPDSNSKTREKKLAFWGGVALASAYIAISNGLALHKDYAAESWPITTGTVIATNIQHRCGRANSHNPVVTYQYEIGGKEYNSQRLYFGGSPCFSESTARAVVQRYPTGRILDIRVNPSEPNEAVIELGTHREDLSFWMSAFIPVLVLSVWQFWRTIRG